jgi:hypothetical protein
MAMENNMAEDMERWILKDRKMDYDGAHERCWLPELSTFHLRLNYRYRKTILVRLLWRRNWINASGKCPCSCR